MIDNLEQTIEAIEDHEMVADAKHCAFIGDFQGLVFIANVAMGRRPTESLRMGFVCDLADRLLHGSDRVVYGKQ
jgi:hypothetical protein